MNTAVVSALSSAERGPAVGQAVELLHSGEVVALPTETVYGLAADALNVDAVVKIFEAKERPRFDPLIVHVSDSESVEKIAIVPVDTRNLINSLMRAFWPGPLTFVLPRREKIPDLVTAGLGTVAVRMSAHPVFAAVVREFGGALAAPSANRFGRISPTRAEDVLAELGGRIPLIVDGGSTQHGLESTIISVRDLTIEILRQGPVTLEHLKEFAPTETARPRSQVVAPGQLPSHYAPRTLLVLAENASEFVPAPHSRCGLLAWNPAQDTRKFAIVRLLSAAHNFTEAAANLFRYLRELDAANLDLIVAEAVPEHGLGAAIMDRLQRAAK